MRRVEVYQQGALAGVLEELDRGRWRFTYADGYAGESVSLTMPAAQAIHEFDRFPSPFEGLLPEGIQLEAMLRRHKLDRADFFGQLIVVGQDLVGSLIVKEVA
jgi:serine/threonine-protein kinase HipA